jgi:hypothetical protein
MVKYNIGESFFLAIFYLDDDDTRKHTKNCFSGFDYIPILRTQG